MRTTISITASGGLVSELKNRKLPHALSVGDVLELVNAFATEHGEVPAGAKGVVDHIDEADGVIWLRMVGTFPALMYWDNLLVLSPFDCEDLITSIKLSVDKQVASVSVRQLRRLAACIMALLFY